MKCRAAALRSCVQTVGLRQSGCRAARELTVPLPLAKWQSLGVRTAAGGALPKVDRAASLLRAGAKTYLVYSQLRLAARLQLRARLCARRRPAVRSDSLSWGQAAIFSDSLSWGQARVAVRGLSRLQRIAKNRGLPPT